MHHQLQMIVRPMMQGRPYHNVDHVLACLAALDQYRHLAHAPEAIKLALWLHDAVYDPTRHDNEVRSAELSDRLLVELGYDTKTVSTVHQLILATCHNCDPVAHDGRLIADIDLLVLAAPPAAFERYEHQIRQEYQHVPDADFNRGRVAVLTRFLQRRRIFYLLREYEQQARLNLQRSITRLSDR